MTADGRSWSGWAQGLGLAALTVLGLAMSWIARGDDLLLEATTITIQVGFAVAAAALWPDRYQRGNAALLVLAGFFNGVSSMNGAAFWQLSPKLHQLGYAFGGFSTPFVVIFLLRFPVPNPPFTLRRLFTGLVWACAAEQAVRTLFWDWSALGPPPAVSWWTLYPSRPVFDASMTAAGAVAVTLCGWFLVVQVGRFRTAAGPAARTVRLISVVGMVLAGALALRTVTGVVGELGPDTGLVGEAVGVGDNLVVAVAVITMLVATVRQAVRRSDVVERLLSVAGDPQAVQAALRRELGDPSLTVTFRLDDGWRDAEGRPVVARRASADRIGFDVGAAGVVTARIDTVPSVQHDPARLRVTLAAAGLVLENTRLTVERQAHLTELAASRTRLVEAGTEQRRRLERDLHDGAQQSLLGVAATLSRADLATDREDMSAAVGEARRQLLAAIEELRRLARGIHPSALSQGGLGTALTSLAGRTARIRLDLDPELQQGRRLPAPLETAAYFVVAEAVANALKHGGDGPVAVTAHLLPDRLEVSVANSGPGRPTVVPGGGLSGLLDRVHALGGDLDLRSRPGGGSLVRARLPLRGRAGR